MESEYKYSPESLGYLGNGHYKIAGTEYMSVWKYKDCFHYGRNNSKMENANVTMEMDAKFGLVPFKCIMEIGDMAGEYVQLHRIDDLKMYLPVLKFTIGKKK